MNVDLRELYQEVILDHNKSPRNRGEMEGASSSAEGQNPLCGDEVKIYVKVANGIVEAVQFDGHGCAISTASASIMTEAVQGKTVEEASSLISRFQAVVTGHHEVTEEDDFGDLVALAGVRDFPVRIKCATLPWHTLKAAIEGHMEAVSTE